MKKGVFKNYRVCPICGRNLPLTRDYFKRLVVDKKEAFHKTCKECEAKLYIEKEWKDGKLLCHMCGQYLDPSEFATHENKHRDNKDRRCRKCRHKQTIQRRKNLDQKEQLRQILQMRFLGARDRAKRLNIPFDITKDYLQYLWDKQKGLCAISNIPMTHLWANGRTPTNVSIDQINPHLGYTKDNIQLVCMAVNQMKNDLSMEELYMFCESILNARKWKH